MTGKVIDTIKRAMLLIGAIDPQKTPSGSEADACLTELRDLVPALPGWSGWTEVTISQDWAPQGEDYRITVIGDVDVAITLPQLVWDDGVISCDGGGLPVEHGTFQRAPRDGARILACSQATGDQAFYTYCADVGQWRNVLGLGHGDDVPVNADMAGHLAALLAERIAPVFGLPLAGEAAQAVGRARLAWEARYDRRKTINRPSNRAEALGVYM